MKREEAVTGTIGPVPEMNDDILGIFEREETEKEGGVEEEERWEKEDIFF